MSDPLIRRAGREDAETLVAIGVATFLETFGHLYPQSDLDAYLEEAYSLARTRSDLADPAKASWLVESDGAAVAYASVGPCGLPHPDVTPNCGEVKRIYVLAAWHGAGLAPRLFAEATAWLETAGRRKIWLGVWSENHRALAFYARRGFDKVGEYDFPVGETIDREFILRREPVATTG